MNLLEKFEAVKIEADNRISSADKALCERHQAAYEAALSAFRELVFIRQDMERQQYELMGGPGTPFREDYLYSYDGPRFTVQLIEKHLEELHGMLIKSLVEYFNNIYHISVDAQEVTAAMLPPEPEKHWNSNKEEWAAYHSRLQELQISYSDVVDQVILRMNGRSFSEQAFFELQARCHAASWNSYDSTPRFERKKATIQFNSYSCSCDTFYNTPRWKLCDKTRVVLHGLAHFETGSYEILPMGISNLLGYDDIHTDVMEFPSCEKVKQLKMFKKGRVDIKFASEAFAVDFIDRYLGTLP